MKIEIKPFHGDTLTKEDLDQMVSLFRQLDNDEIADYGNIGLKMKNVRDLYLANKIEKDSGFIAVCDGKIVGMVSNVEVREYENAMYLSKLVVDPIHRMRGIGRMLVERAIDENKRNGKGTMLSVSVRNEAAIALYKSLGFVVHSQTMVSSATQPVGKAGSKLKGLK